MRVDVLDTVVRHWLIERLDQQAGLPERVHVGFEGTVGVAGAAFPAASKRRAERCRYPHFRLVAEPRLVFIPPVSWPEARMRYREHQGGIIAHEQSACI